MKVLITCAGEARRWEEENTFKQLVDVEGEVLLDRTVRQCFERGQWPTIVARDRLFHRVNTDFFVPESSRWWVSTALSTEPLWSDRTVLLLGDVFFSEECMDRIFSDDGLKVYGRINSSEITGGWAEVFAMSWDAGQDGVVRDALIASIEHAENVKRDGRNPMGSSKPGLPWQPYRLLDGLDIDKDAVGTRGVWAEIDDWTDDFDTLERYCEWKYRRSVWRTSNEG